MCVIRGFPLSRLRHTSLSFSGCRNIQVECERPDENVKKKKAFPHKLPRLPDFLCIHILCIEGKIAVFSVPIKGVPFRFFSVLKPFIWYSMVPPRPGGRLARKSFVPSRQSKLPIIIPFLNYHSFRYKCFSPCRQSLFLLRWINIRGDWCDDPH